MNYDSMSAEDLFEAFGHLHSDGVLDAEYPFQRYGGTWAKKCYELEAIIRRAVIRESSVGEIEVKVRESGDDLSRSGDPYRIVTASEKFICQAWIPEGTYYLIKKETP